MLPVSKKITDNEYRPTESITVSHENEKVREVVMSAKIKIKSNEPTTPNILERLVKIISPRIPPDESWGKKSPLK